MHDGNGLIYIKYVLLYIFFYFQLANINNFCLQNWYNISLMATVRGICELVLTVCYILWDFLQENEQISYNLSPK